MNIETPLQQKLKAVIDSRQIKVDDLSSPRHRGYLSLSTSNSNNKTMTGNGTKATASELQKRLKVCINSEASNKQCCDCNDAKPTWASLIMVPDDAKHWSTSRTLACVVCYACAAAHRSLGTHISRVKSCNLDEWSEKEVIAMELGGNAVINSIFEATLVSFNSNNDEASTASDIKPTPRVDNTTRTNFIREKYDKRNFYDASKYADVPTIQPTYQQRRPSGCGSTSFGGGGDDQSSMNNSSMMYSKSSLVSGSIDSRMMMSPRRSSQPQQSFGGSGGQLNKVLSRGSMQSATQKSVRSFHSNTSEGLDSIGIDRVFATPKSTRESLTYADLFEPSEHDPTEVDESENDFLGLTNTSSNISGGGSSGDPMMMNDDFGNFDNVEDNNSDFEDDDDGGVDSEDDLFADSATTATDLFGHSTNYPKKKNYNPNLGGAIREETSESWDPFAAEDDGGGNDGGAPAAPSPASPPAPPPPMFAESPALSTFSKKSTKSAPPRPNYGGKNDDLWRSPVSKTPGGSRKLGRVSIGADGTARVSSGSLRKLGGGSSSRKMNSQAVMSSLDAWLSPTPADKPKIDDISTSPNKSESSSHGRNNRNRPSVRRSTSSPGEEPSPRMTSRKSTRKIRSCSPPPLVDADEPDDHHHNQDFEAIQGEVDLFTGFQGFDKQFVVAGGDVGDSKNNSPSNRSAQSQKVNGNTLESFFQTDDGVDGTWSPKSFPGQAKASDKARPGGSGIRSRRRDSSSGASIGSHKSSSSNNNGISPRRKSSKDLRPPLTPSSAGGGRALRRSSTAGSSRTLSSTSTNGSAGNKSSESPTSIMEMNNNNQNPQNEHSNSGDEDNDWAADFGNNNNFDDPPAEKRRSEYGRSSRSERRSSRTATSSSSPQRRRSSESGGPTPVVSASVHRRSTHRRSSSRGSNAKTSRSPSRERRPRASTQRRRTSSQTSSDGSPGPSASDRRSSSRRSTSRSTSVTSSHSRPSRSPSRERRSSHHRRGSNNSGGGGSHHHRPSRSPSRERRSSHRRGSSGNTSRSRHDRSSRSPSVERRSIRNGRRKPSTNGWQSPMAGGKQEAY